MHILCCLLDAKVVVWFGGGEVDIILDDIQCVGNEANLLQCTHGNEVNNCKAAGVSCGNSPLHAFMFNVIFMWK